MSVSNIIQQQLGLEPLAKAKHLVVAYSGGVDSHVLLHVLHSLKVSEGYDFELSAIHIHHGLSENADTWQQHCQQVCQQLNIPFQTANLVLELKPRQSLEALARDMRYQKLQELAPVYSQVLLGQHQDDQLETFLLQLKRGAGPKGLSGMSRAWSVKTDATQYKQLSYYRPLLDVSRQDILAYAQLHHLKWVEDESNQDVQFERNFLRQRVLPVMQERWPTLARTVSRSASLCAEQQALLEESCEEKLQGLRSGENSLDISGLQLLSQAWMHQVVRYWLNQQGIQSPSMAVLNRLKPEVFEAKDDATPILQWQGWQFRRFDQLLFVIAVPAAKVDFKQRWQGEKLISLPDDFGELEFIHVSSAEGIDNYQLRFDPNLGPIDIRIGGYSAKFKPQISPHSKPIKQWFKQWKIPPWKRDKAIILSQNDSVLSVFCDNQWRHAEQQLESSDITLVKHTIPDY